MKSAKIDQKFWKSFAKNYWEKAPLKVEKAQSPLLALEASEIFKLLVKLSDLCRKNRDPEGFKFYIDGFKADAEDVLQVLPEKKDKSLLGYHARMAKEFPDYCLVCDELLQVESDKHHLLKSFTAELYQEVGFPHRFSEMGLYLGNYRKTPFGVHVDNCGVFSFPVVGKKSFRLWTPDYVEKNPDLNRAFFYDKHKKNSVLLQAEPGDLTYWPSSAWHIAESDGSFSATWSLGVWVDKPFQSHFGEVLNQILSQRAAPSKNLSTTQFKKLNDPNGEVTDLPGAYQKALKDLKNLSADFLEAEFLKAWMKHISMQGFKTLPQGTTKLSSVSWIQLRSGDSPVLWTQNKVGKGVHVSFAGSLIENITSKPVLRIIHDLNSGKTICLEKALKGRQKLQDLKILQLLADAGAVNQVIKREPSR